MININAIDPDRLPDYLTVTQAAALSGLCEESIRRRARSGELRAYKLGARKWSFDKADVLALRQLYHAERTA